MAAIGAKRLAVIGAGMVGVCAASWLQRDGHSVFLIEASAPGRGASLGNAGCFNGSSVTPVAMPGVIRNVPRWLFDPLGPLSLRWSYLPAIAPWLLRFARAGTPEKVRAQARALRPLVGPSLEALKPLVSAAGAEHLVHRLGHLYVYRSAAGPEKDRLAWDLRRENGVQVEEFDADELRQLEPALSRDFVRGLLVRENGHTSDPLALVERLVEHFLRSGGELVHAEARGFRLESRRLAAIDTSAGELPADAAIVCGGAYSKPLAAVLGDKVPLETERGYHLMVRDPEVMPHIPTADADGKFVATPMDTGLRFAGTVELAGLAAPPDWRRARILLELGRRMLPGLAASYPQERISVWMGHRPSLPDSLPVIGPSRATPDVIYAFGHGHVGMTAAPMTGKLVTDLVAGRRPAIDIAPFTARRFA
ncbi:MAG: FAD-dependent oxidoreductase [Alphaproteobacteria bacterium]|nr:FAD-dependent oxidoreductase [Alphaproteobacteria bacterium]